MQAGLVRSQVSTCRATCRSRPTDCLTDVARSGKGVYICRRWERRAAEPLWRLMRRERSAVGGGAKWLHGLRRGYAPPGRRFEGGKKKNQSSAGMNLRAAEQLGASDPGSGAAGSREEERDELETLAGPGSR